MRAFLRRLARLRHDVALSVLAAAALGMPSAAASSATPLTGTFALTAGSCASGTATGSYFRMILHNGGTNGPFLSNSDSTCRDQTYTLLQPGTDRGLRAGSFQPQPSPAFDSNGNGRADRITEPTAFYGVKFATSTNQVDPQTRVRVATPTVWRDGSHLTADLRSFAVSWNNQQFNQGSPKPNGSLPGNTRAVTGTYDAATGAFTLHWSSQIQGGPFDGFTGLWQLTGHFSAAAASAQPAPTDNGTHPVSAASAPATGATAATAPTSAPSGGSKTATTAPSSATSSAAALPPESLPSAGSFTADTRAGTGGASSDSHTRTVALVVAWVLVGLAAASLGAQARRRLRWSR